MSSDEHIKSITGRDGYIVAQALYQACKYQQRLKDEKSPLYEWSNHQDMKAILNEAYGPMAGVFLAQDRYMGRDIADLHDEKKRREPEVVAS